MCEFRKARDSDVAAITHLVNAANSGDGGSAGWTHERDLFEGERTCEAEIRTMLTAAHSTFILGIDGRDVLGCAYVKPVSTGAYMGLLAVRPMRQSQGLGSALIELCERVALHDWAAPRMTISVITSHRPELVSFYERRGYARTGRLKQFERLNVRVAPHVKGLALEWMEKDLH